MKSKITESQLRDRIASLESKIDEITAQDVGQAVGNVAGGAAGLVASPVRAAGEIGQAVANKAGDWWNQAKQGVQNFAQGAAQGAKQGWAATDPAKMAGQAAAAIGATTAKYPTTPQEIKAFQQAHGLTADGIIGPKTQAALAQAGLKPAAPAPAATTKPGQAASTTGTTKPAVPTKPAAAPQTTAQQGFAQAGMAGQEMRTPAEIQASKDLGNVWENTTFKNEDSLARIIQLTR